MQAIETAPAFPHTVIRASAGTGKTYQLSNRYLGLVHAGVEPERILATTFTRKAAGEILQRVLERLAVAADRPAALEQLAAALGDPQLSRHRCLELLTVLARNLHRLRISTLDSFFAQLATSFSLELGLPPGWRIVEPHAEAALRREAMEDVLAADEGREIQRLMHLMTKGDADRSVGELLRSTVDNLYAVFLATDEAAWRNFPPLAPLRDETLEAAIEQLGSVELPAGKRWQAARAADLEAALRQDWDAFISRGLAPKVLDESLTYCRKRLPEEIVAVYRRLLRHAEAFYLQQLKQQTGATYELLARFDAAFRQRKRAARALGFDDVTRCLAQSHELTTLARTAYRLDGDIAHLLLDEFQDTSYWQWRVLQPFARRVTSGSSGPSTQPGSSFFCVGDVKQAIYGWRGGRSEIFAAIESQLAGLQPQALSQSRRSARAIMDTVNRVFTCLGQHPGLEREVEAVQQWCDQFLPHTTVHQNKSGYVRLETAPRAVATEQSAATCRYVAEKVAQLVRDCPGREIGVLVRKNATVARVIFELKRLGIAASEEGGNPLTDAAAVATVLALLRLADHPGDTVARYHVACSPLGRAVGYCRWQDDRAAEELAAATRRQLVLHGYGPTIRRWSGQIAAACSAREQSRLEQLVQLAYDYQADASLRPTDFVRLVESQRVADPQPATVRVMTVHQSKGLEFEIVVATEFEEGLIGQAPTCVVSQPDIAAPVERVSMYRSADIQQLLPADMQPMFAEAARQDVVESLCVLYVALTRAVSALYLVLDPAKANERKLPRTVAGCLRASLADGVHADPATCLYEAGDPTWYRAAAPRPRPAAPPRVPRGRIRFAPACPQQTAMRHAAPSGLEGGARVPLSRVLRLDPVAAFERGTLLHAWFEQIHWLEDGRPAPESFKQQALRLVTSRTNIDQALKHFSSMLDAPEVSAVLRRDYYNETHEGNQIDERVVHNERRFAVRVDQQLMSGAVDRLVLLKSRGRVVAADIVDFKTDGLAAGATTDLERAVAFYRPQQQAYRAAVARLYGLPESSVTARLVFVVPRVVVQIH